MPELSPPTLTTMLRSALYNVAFYLNLILWCAVAFPTLVLPRRYFMRVARLWGVSSVWLLKVIAGTDVRWSGLENLSDEGCILASKHQSTWETFALFLILKDPAFILKRELMFIPFFGWYLIKGDMIPVRRGQTGREGLAMLGQKAREAVAAGRQLIIFPEGTRRPAGAPADYKSGVAHLYSATGARCVPVALNSGLYWPRRALLKRPGTIEVEVLEPIAPGMRPKAFLALLRERIETASARLLAEGLRETGR
ncbi:1-acyl-sn-glycerol-3-phosphate acyltransferase [Rhizobiales bacterium GAS191]|jgi:1-acyl-sn-glycerol-3-phosphate acyltransferase|nr:1-acyl-sn-glycerol-3-phosphate acyltransferase [Rhizobiales bacterium GAS113]SED48329.1 1-acyl-sn-glycerol-3-phosphate acyltransferase [Rhizobiales bacterium GAS188]SEE92114.1 1-acyl-sn-glycerol-3-phosphate acyltransferase [Rhizobiales bacterium GAS191]